MVTGLLLISSNAISKSLKYNEMADDLLARQQYKQWQANYSAEPFFLMNGRPFYITINQFADIISNTFSQCEDLDAYTDRKGTTQQCQKYIFQGLKEWVGYSKDPTVSVRSWEIGKNYSAHYENGNPNQAIWDFNGWAAGIRVAKSKGY